MRQICTNCSGRRQQGHHDDDRHGDARRAPNCSEASDRLLAHFSKTPLPVEDGDRKHVMLGSSLGAGRVFVSEIDGFPVEVHGGYHTIVMVAEDVKGSIARIASIIADDGLNIATLRLTRKERGGDAFIVIELDESPNDKALADIRGLSWVRWSFALDKVSA